MASRTKRPTKPHLALVPTPARAPAIGLAPLRLEPIGPWDPADAGWGGDGEPTPTWLAPILARGPRTAYELEDAAPRGAEAYDETPLVRACLAYETGDDATARRLLEEALARDVRYLDAHAHLGLFAFDTKVAEALAHYRTGATIGRLSLGADFEGFLPWFSLENRPFLRCLHGLALCLWRKGDLTSARATFEQMLWLNPTDNQGARFNLEDLDAGLTWAKAQRDGGRRR